MDEALGQFTACVEGSRGVGAELHWTTVPVLLQLAVRIILPAPRRPEAPAAAREDRLALTVRLLFCIRI